MKLLLKSKLIKFNIYITFKQLPLLQSSMYKFFTIEYI